MIKVTIAMNIQNDKNRQFFEARWPSLPPFRDNVKATTDRR